MFDQRKHREREREREREKSTEDSSGTYQRGKQSSSEQPISFLMSHALLRLLLKPIHMRPKLISGNELNLVKIMSSASFSACVDEHLITRPAAEGLHGRREEAAPARPCPALRKFSSRR